MNSPVLLASDEWKRVPSIVTGDVIRFKERVFRGRFPHRKRRGHRIVIARVVRESYGARRQQHSFTIGYERDATRA
jgi:hypothetical protein